MRIADAIVQNFKMMSHLFNGSHETRYVVGLDIAEDNNSDKIVVLELEKGKFKTADDKKDSQKFEEISIPKDSTVVNIISQRFTDSLYEILVTTTKDGETFNNYLVDLNEDKGLPKVLFESISTPLLATNPDDISCLLIYGQKERDGSHITAVGKIDFDSGEFNMIKTFDKVKLKGIHSSSFVDLGKQMHPCLVLHEVGDKGNQIIFCNLSADLNINIISKHDIPNETGPILFTELFDPINTDIVFVSKENGKYFLHVFKNKSINANLKAKMVDLNSCIKIFDSEFYKDTNQDLEKELDLEEIVLPLNESFINNFVPILKENLTSIPKGIFARDIAAEGINSIFLIAENPKNSVEKRIFIFKINPQTNQLHLVEDNNAENANKALAFSDQNYFAISEFNMSGFEGYLLQIEAPFNLIYHGVEVDNNEDGINLMALSTINDKTPPGYISGATFLILYENHTKIIKVSQSMQSSFPSLQKFAKYTGLGKTNLFINFVSVKIPRMSQNNKKLQNRYTAVSLITPNTSSVFLYTIRNNRWSMKSYFSQIYYFSTLIGAIGSVIIFLVIFIMSSILAQIKKNKATGKKASNGI